MHEKRLIDRLTDYWSKLKKDKPLPEFERFNSAAIADMYTQCLVLEVETPSNKQQALYTYHYMGDDIIKAYGSDLTGHYVNVHMHNFPGWQVLQSVDKIHKSPEVTSSQGSFVNDQDHVVKYRACILPFGKKDRITHALVGLSWKTFS